MNNRQKQQTHEDIIYHFVFKYFIGNDYTRVDSGAAAANALRLYRRNMPHQKAIKKAIRQGLKLYKTRN